MLTVQNTDKAKIWSVERTPWPAKGFVTLKQILGRNGGPIPLSASRWWLGVRTGEFPQPLKVGGRTVWRVTDIDALVVRLESR
jgi:predicted DNA-binding transcriptional regulator AlpA